jgi:hypothetical protein
LYYHSIIHHSILEDVGSLCLQPYHYCDVQNILRSRCLSKNPQIKVHETGVLFYAVRNLAVILQEEPKQLYVMEDFIYGLFTDVLSSSNETVLNARISE